MSNIKTNIDREVEKHDEKLDKKKIKFLGFISFFMGFSQAFFIYIMSSYFQLATGTENIGLFYFAAYSLSLIVTLHFHKLVRCWGKSTVFYMALAGKLIIITFLLNVEASFAGALLLMIYIIFSSLEWVSLDIILESFSTDRLSGRIRGRHWAVINAGFLVGPFLSTQILDQFGFHGIFFLQFLFNCFILLLIIWGMRNVNHKFNNNVKVRDLIRKVMARKDVLRIYYISFVLEFFFALMVIYTPIYLTDLGMNWKDIGVVFTIMLIPFVLVQYPMGALADKKWGEKEFIIISLVVMSISTLGVFFTSSVSVAIWSVILLGTRIGAAMLEVLRDSYFYKRIDGYDVDIINFYRTAMPASYIVSTLISGTLLWIFPGRVELVFLVISLAVFSGLVPAIMLVDNKGEKEIRLEAQKIVN